VYQDATPTTGVFNFHLNGVVIMVNGWLNRESESSAAPARLAGDEAAADGYFREAYGFALGAAKRAAEVSSQAERLEILRLAVRLALECGEAVIGLRYERTEQTVSGWVREAIREMKFNLEAPAARPVPTREP
jgi:hypothetical protein